jgi:hypothetical protein
MRSEFLNQRQKRKFEGEKEVWGRKRNNISGRFESGGPKKPFKSDNIRFGL